ncbi:tetratricopeptide repeat protein [bacterium]|nr:tetratricopeptide repeat protein [bacterium]
MERKPGQTDPPLAGSSESAPTIVSPTGRTTAPASPPQLPTPFPTRARASASSAGEPAPRIGKYVITGELGRGGMGVVYRALDTALRREVAIKMILDPTRAGPELLKRFEAEASATARLRHPGIVSVHEVGFHEGRPFLVMELIQGESLEALLRREPMAPRRAAEVIREVALALAHAHASGVVHRDVKPENVLVDKEGRPHLMDFGLAREVGEGQRMTVTGQVLGTPAYMSPEQAAGETRRQGPASDVYSLGAVLYRALVGKPPFEAPSIPALMTRVMFDEPDPPRRTHPKVHVDLETIALRCLAKEPERRYASATVVAEELARFLAGEPIVARPISGLERARRWARKNRKLTLALLALALVLPGALVAIALVVRASESERVRETRKWQEEQARAARNRESAVRKLHDLEEHEIAGETRPIPEYTKIIDEAPDLADAWAHRGMARAMAGDPKGGLADAEKAIEISPAFAGGWGTRGWIEVQMRDYERGIADASKAIELDPKRPTPWGVRGDAKRMMGDAKGAVADLDRAIERNRAYVGALIARGLLKTELGDQDGAMADFDDAIRFNPKAARAWNGRGIAKEKRGEVDGAIADYTCAIELSPDAADALANRGHARLERDLDLAIADLTRALEKQPANARVWCNRAIARRRKGDLDAALADNARAIELDPRDPYAWSNRGTIRLNKRDVDGALEDLARAIELKPDYAEAFANRGAARYAKGDVDGALVDFDRAIALNPKIDSPYYNRGGIRFRRGDLAGATSDYEKLIEVAPKTKYAEQARAILAQLRKP